MNNFISLFFIIILRYYFPLKLLANMNTVISSFFCYFAYSEWNA